jgi:hypothetical protein
MQQGEGIMRTDTKEKAFIELYRASYRNCYTHNYPPFLLLKDTMYPGMMMTFLYVQK